MKIKRNINVISLAIWVLLIVTVTLCSIFTLRDQFGLFGGSTEYISEYNVEFTMNYNNDIKFENGKKIYLHESREYFCEITNMERNSDTVLVKAKINGFYKDGSFWLNGKHYIAKNSTVFIMNNKTEIKILEVY